MKYLFIIVTASLLGWVVRPACAKPPQYSAYPLAYFTGNDKTEEAIRFALSPDGLHYPALNGDRPVSSSAKISETGEVLRRASQPAAGVGSATYLRPAGPEIPRVPPLHLPPRPRHGPGGGFHREVCLDKLEFNPNGSLRPVVPTQAGIQPVQVT